MGPMGESLDAQAAQVREDSREATGRTSRNITTLRNTGRARAAGRQVLDFGLRLVHTAAAGFLSTAANDSQLFLAEARCYVRVHFALNLTPLTCMRIHAHIYVPYFRIRSFDQMASLKAARGGPGASSSSALSASRREEPQRVERPGLSQEEIDELDEAFKLFDVENTGPFRWIPQFETTCRVPAFAPLPRSPRRLPSLRLPAPGLIDAAELKSAMESLGYKHKNKMVYNMIESMPAGMISFPQFLDLMTARVSDTDSRDDIAKVSEPAGTHALAPALLCPPSSSFPPL